MEAERAVAELERFLADRGDQLLRTATLLAGSREAGEDLLQTGLERLLRHWAAIDANPEGYLRRTLLIKLRRPGLGTGPPWTSHEQASHAATRDGRSRKSHQTAHAHHKRQAPHSLTLRSRRLLPHFRGQNLSRSWKSAGLPPAAPGRPRLPFPRGGISASGRGCSRVFVTDAR